MCSTNLATHAKRRPHRPVDGDAHQRMEATHAHDQRQIHPSIIHCPWVGWTYVHTYARVICQLDKHICMHACDLALVDTRSCMMGDAWAIISTYSCPQRQLECLTFCFPKAFISFAFYDCLFGRPGSLMVVGSSKLINQAY